MDYNVPNNFNNSNYKDDWCPWFKAIIIVFIAFSVYGIISNIGALVLILTNPYIVIRFYMFSIVMLILFILLSIVLLVGEIGLLMKKSWGFYILVIAFVVSFILNIINAIGSRYWIGLLGSLIPLLEGVGLIYLVMSGVATLNKQNPFAQEIAQLPIPSQFSQNLFSKGFSSQPSALPQCPNCGAPLQPNQKFCSRCGHSVQE